MKQNEEADEVSTQEWMYYGDMEEFMFKLLHLQVSLHTEPTFPSLSYANNEAYVVWVPRVEPVQCWPPLLVSLQRLFVIADTCSEPH